MSTLWILASGGAPPPVTTDDIEAAVSDLVQQCQDNATTYLGAALLVAAVFVLYRLGRRSISKL